MGLEGDVPSAPPVRAQHAPEQMAQMRQLTRGKRSFDLNPFAILLKILRKILGLPADADPFIIILALVAKLLGLQDEFNVLATSIGLLSNDAAAST